MYSVFPKGQFFPKIYRVWKKTYICSTKTAHPLSHSFLDLTIFMIYTKAHTNIMFIIFAITSKGTIMETRSTRSFNAILAAIIRGFLTCIYQFAM